MSAVAAPLQTHAPAGHDLVRVYVWQWPVRIAHWGIAFSMVVLAVTGFYLGRPFVSVRHDSGYFVTGWFRIVHLYAAIVFTLSLVTRLIWMFVGNRYSRWDQFIPVAKERIRLLRGTFLFYVWRFRKPPGVIGHNPLAAGAYVFVFALEGLMVLTGFALYAAESQPSSLMHHFLLLAPLLGGLARIRWIHHVVMYLLLGFVVHHVYSSVLVAAIERNATIDSIITGMKVIDEADLLDQFAPSDLEGPPE